MNPPGSDPIERRDTGQVPVVERNRCGHVVILPHDDSGTAKAAAG
jgi:hypothetical protein